MFTGSSSFLVMFSSSIPGMAAALALAGGPDPVLGTITSSLQHILQNTHGGNEYQYPTDITRDLLPVSSPTFLFLFVLLYTFFTLSTTNCLRGSANAICLDSRSFPQVGDTLNTGNNRCLNSLFMLI